MTMIRSTAFPPVKVRAAVALSSRRSRSGKYFDTHTLCGLVVSRYSDGRAPSHPHPRSGHSSEKKSFLNRSRTSVLVARAQFQAILPRTLRLGIFVSSSSWGLCSSSKMSIRRANGQPSWRRWTENLWSPVVGMVPTFFHILGIFSCGATSRILISISFPGSARSRSSAPSRFSFSSNRTHARPQHLHSFIFVSVCYVSPSFAIVVVTFHFPAFKVPVYSQTEQAIEFARRISW